MTNIIKKLFPQCLYKKIENAALGFKILLKTLKYTFLRVESKNYCRLHFKLVPTYPSKNHTIWKRKQQLLPNKSIDKTITSWSNFKYK